MPRLKDSEKFKSIVNPDQAVLDRLNEIIRTLGFPFGPINRQQVDLLEQAIKLKKEKETKDG